MQTKESVIDAISKYCGNRGIGNLRLRDLISEWGFKHRLSMNTLPELLIIQQRVKEQFPPKSPGRKKKNLIV